MCNKYLASIRKWLQIISFMRWMKKGRRRKKFISTLAFQRVDFFFSFSLPILMQLKIDCAKMKFQQWIKNFYIGILKWCFISTGNKCLNSYCWKYEKKIDLILLYSLLPSKLPFVNFSWNITTSEWKCKCYINLKIFCER